MNRYNAKLLGQLRSILHEPPPSKAWEQLFAIAEALDTELFKDTVRHDALTAFDTVPGWRHIARPVPRRWLDRLCAGEPAPWVALCDRVSCTSVLTRSHREDEMLRERAQKDASLFARITHVELAHDPYEALVDALCMTPSCTLRDLAFHSIPDTARLIRKLRTTHVDTLTITNQPLSDGLIQVIFSNVQCLALRHVNLRRTGLSLKAVAHLLAHPSTPQWRSLDLSQNRHTLRNELDLILKHPRLAQLTTLALAECSLGVEELRALNDPHVLPSLTSIDIQGNLLHRLEPVYDWASTICDYETIPMTAHEVRAACFPDRPSLIVYDSDAPP